MNDSTSDDIQRVQGTTPDFKTEFAKQLSELAPELVTDGKIDGKKLQELLDGDEADDSERFGLFWPGKKRAMRAAQEPTTATLKPAREESKDWDTTQNLFIEGDNLEVLKVLQKHYHNKIKMIYIDPPYNTGKDFVYPDNYKEGLASYLEFTNQVDNEGRKVSTNSDTDGRYHSNWLNMMYPRLKLSRNLLRDDGVIFISIDDSEQSNLKKVADEIFGEGNFVGSLIKPSKVGGGSDSKHIVKEHEYVLAYARNIAKLPEMFISHDTEYLLRYRESDENGKYFWDTYARPGLATGSNDSLIYSISMPDGSEITTRWRRSKDRYEQDLKDGIIKLTKRNDGKWSVQFKQYLNDSGKKPRSFTSNLGDNNAGRNDFVAVMKNAKIFDYPKPIALVKFLATIICDKNSIVLDFFAGSASTAHALMRLNAEDGGNRKHIQVQLPEPTDEKSEAHKAGYKNISDIAKDRIRRAGEQIKIDFADKLFERDEPLDVGFKVYKLSGSNFTKWRSQSDTDKDSLQQHLLDIRESSNDAASEEDLLTEVLLKQGISLTAPISHDEVDGLSVWTVGENLVCAYLNEKQEPSLDQLRAIAAKEPAKLIILEDAFQGDDELKTNLHQICKSQKIELWTV